MVGIKGNGRLAVPVSVPSHIKTTIQRTLVITTVFVTKEFAVKLNLLL